VCAAGGACEECSKHQPSPSINKTNVNDAAAAAAADDDDDDDRLETVHTYATDVFYLFLFSFFAVIKCCCSGIKLSVYLLYLFLLLLLESNSILSLTHLVVNLHYRVINRDPITPQTCHYKQWYLKTSKLV